LPVGETQTVLLKFSNLPPIGFFKVRTELQLPNDFGAGVPVETTVSNDIFIAPEFVWSFMGLLLIGGLLVRRLRRKTKVVETSRLGVLA